MTFSEMSCFVFIHLVPEFFLDKMIFDFFMTLVNFARFPCAEMHRNILKFKEFNLCIFNLIQKF